MSLTNFTPIGSIHSLSKVEAVAKAFADHLAKLSGATRARVASGVCFARDDLIVCVGGEGADLSTAAGSHDWCAIILLWNPDRPASSRFNVVVQEKGRTEYFPHMQLLIDEVGRAHFTPSHKNEPAVMIGRSGPIPGATPAFQGDKGWSNARQRALDVLFEHEEVAFAERIAASRHLAGAGLRTVRNIARLWDLTPDEEARLLGIDMAKLAEVEHSSEPISIPDIALLRISAVFGIYAALESLLPARSKRWISHPNQGRIFAGHPPLELMLSEDFHDLLSVRRYLDAQFT